MHLCISHGSFTKAGEFWAKVNKCIFVSATPGKFELELSNPEKLRSAPRSRAGTVPAEKALHATTLTASADVPFPKLQPRRRKAAGRSGLLGWDEIGDIVDAQAVIRPTGITDPPVDIRPSEGQVADLVRECRARGERGERVLVTALTKRMAGEVEYWSCADNLADPVVVACGLIRRCVTLRKG